MAKPETGEWLDQHQEAGQTFSQYKRFSPVSPTDTRKVIYLQPIGKFDTTQQAHIKYTSEYLHLFFGLKTIILPNIQDDIIPDTARRMGSMGNE